MAKNVLSKCNEHYLRRYHRFIEIMKIRKLASEYTETHHIQPRCMQGTDDPSNLIVLTLREHYLAHWLLWKAYPTIFGLASAFLQMTMKNPKHGAKPNHHVVTGRVYESLRKQVYDGIGQFTRGYVHVRDSNGIVIKLTRQEFESSNHKFHTKGMVRGYDEHGIMHYVTREEYRSRGLMHPASSKQGNFPRYEYRYIDLETNDIVRLDRLTARTKNKQAGYQRFKQAAYAKDPNRNSAPGNYNRLGKPIAARVQCVDSHGTRYSVLSGDYNPNVHEHVLKNRLIVFDCVTQEKRTITREEYNSDPARYNTSTKGRVLAKDQHGRRCVVTRDEYISGEYVGQTRGLRMMKDLHTGIFVQVTQEQLDTCAGRYVGPNLGKVNVINKLTGERKQIDKSEFDRSIYVGLGAKNLLFKAKHRLTGKIKNINIYEWKLVENQYEIIDIDKFIKLKSTLT